MTTDPGESSRDPSGLAALIARAASDRRIPPVERWSPPHCGAIDMAIDGQGRWTYMGTPIAREALVRLFSTVLRREGDDYVLVTPVEKVSIRVADAPFMAVEMHAEGAGTDRRLTLRTNVGDLVEVGPDHRLRFALSADGGLVPYVHVRAGLEAKFTRPLAQALADLVEEDADGRLVVGAGGLAHPLPDGALDAPGGSA